MIADRVTPLDQARPKVRYRSQEELEMREAIDAWGRRRWPDARVVHELVMDRGSVRADMAFVSPNHLVSVEIKSGYDGTERLLNQVAMFRLATPETWVVVVTHHLRDVALVRYLLPTIGVAKVERRRPGDPFDVIVVHEAQQFDPHPEAMLSLLWAPELYAEATKAGVWRGQIGSHAALVQRMLRLDPKERLAAVCRQLRGRNALWRADPAVQATAPQLELRGRRDGGQ